MKISLKRALKLRKELEAQLAKVELPTTVQLSLLVEQNITDPVAAIQPGTEALVKKIDQYVQLSQILADLRVAIADANLQNGVESALAHSAHATRVMSLYKKLMAGGTVPPVEQLKAELTFSQQSLQAPSTGYGRPDRSVQVSVVLPELKENAANQYTSWKRFLEGEEDNRTGKNASVQINIAEADATLLRQLGII